MSRETFVDLILGDCLEVMRNMPDASVDIVFTSPPYNVGLAYIAYDDNREWNEFIDWLTSVYKEIERVLSDGGRIYSVLSDKLLFDLKPIQDKLGLTFVQILTWCKPNLCGGTSRISGDWNFLTEHILLFRKGKRTPMQNGNSNTHSYFVIATPQSNFKEGRFHPAQFPISLPDRILSRTPGDVVLDPFMGTGSTGLASIRNKRNFIGIEIDPNYFSVAEKRVKEAQIQPRLPMADREASLLLDL